jgi:hypothetical protein
MDARPFSAALSTRAQSTCWFQMFVCRTADHEDDFHKKGMLTIPLPRC